jgi:hypothetical protein
MANSVAGAARSTTIGLKAIAAERSRRARGDERGVAPFFEADSGCVYRSRLHAAVSRSIAFGSSFLVIRSTHAGDNIEQDGGASDEVSVVSA